MSATPVVTDQATSNAGQGRRPWKVPVVVIGALAVVVVGVGVYRATESSSSSCGAFAAAYNSAMSSASAPVGDIYLFDERFDTCQQLTRDGQSIDPSISPDGRRVAFISGRGYGFDQDYGLNEFQSAYVMSIDGSGQTRLSTTLAEPPIAWAPDGHRIAYVSDGRRVGYGSGPAQAEVSIINLDKGTRASIPLAPHCGIVQWIDAGHLALQCSRAPNGFAIESVDVSSGAQRQVMTLQPGMSLLSMRYVAVLPVHSRAKRLLVRDLQTQRTHVVQGSEVPDDVASSSSILFATSDGHLIWQRHQYLGPYDVYVSKLAGGPPRLLQRQHGRAYSPLNDNPARQP